MRRTKTGVLICFGLAVWAVCVVSFFLFNSDAGSSSEVPTVMAASPVELVVNGGSLAADDREYDGTDIVTIYPNGEPYFQTLGGDRVYIELPEIGIVSCADVGNGKSVTVDLGAGYTLKTPITVDITKKKLKLAAITVNPKDFDNTHAATVSGATFTPQSYDLLSGGKISPQYVPVFGVDYSVSAQFGDVNVIYTGGVPSGVTASATSVNWALTQTSKCVNFELENINQPELGEVVGSAIIRPKKINLSEIIALNKPFDGTDTATIDRIVWNPTETAGFENILPDVDDVNISAQFIDKSNNPQINVGDYCVRVVGTPAMKENENFEFGSNTLPVGSASITKRTVNLATIRVKSKDYDGTRLAELETQNQLTFKDGNGEPLQISDKYRPTIDDIDMNAFKINFERCEAETGITVTIEGDIMTVPKSNYSIGNERPTTTANINRRPISIATITAKEKVYDGTATITITGATWTNVANLPAGTVPEYGVDFTITGAFEDPEGNVGDDKTVIINQPNYITDKNDNFIPVSGATTLLAKINPRKIELLSIISKNKVFDGTDTAALFSVEFSNVSDLPKVDQVPTVDDLSKTLTRARFEKNGRATYNAGENLTVRMVDADMDKTPGTRAYNFDLIFDKNGPPVTTAASMSIIPRPIELLRIEAHSKDYDGTKTATLKSVAFSNLGPSEGMNAVDVNSIPTLANLNISAEFKYPDVSSGIKVTITAADMPSVNFDFGDDWKTKETTAGIRQCYFSVSEITAEDRDYDGTNVVRINTAKLTGLDGVLDENLHPEIGHDFVISGILDKPDAGVRTVTFGDVVMVTASSKARNFAFEAPDTTLTTTVTINRATRMNVDVPELRTVYEEGITLESFLPMLDETWKWHDESQAPDVFLPGVYNVEVFIPGDNNVFDLVKEVPLTVFHRAPDVSISGSTVSWNNMPNNFGYGIYLDGECVHTTEPDVTSVDLGALGINAGGKIIQVKVFGETHDLDSGFSIVEPSVNVLLIVIIVLLAVSGLGTGSFFGVRYILKAKSEKGQKLNWDSIDENYGSQQPGNYVDNFLKGINAPAAVPMQRPGGVGTAAPKPIVNLDQSPPRPLPVSSTSQSPSVKPASTAAAGVRSVPSVQPAQQPPPRPVTASPSPVSPGPAATPPVAPRSVVSPAVQPRPAVGAPPPRPVPPPPSRPAAPPSSSGHWFD